MSKTGFTTKECPGCGQRNERKSDTVCPECLEAIYTAKKHKQIYENAKADDLLGYIECKIPSSWSSPKYSTFRSNQNNKSLEPIGDRLREIAEFLSVSKGDEVTWGYMRHLENKATFEPYNDIHGKQPNVFSRSKYHSEATVLMPKKIYDLLNKLDNDINNAIIETEKSAVEYGKNALIMLNDGKIRMEDFNKA